MDTTMSESNFTVEFTAKVPAELIREFIQYVRDFDTTHPECEFKIMAFDYSSDMTLSEAEAILQSIDPPIPIRESGLKN